MAKPIKHDMGSATATTAWSAGFGAIAGAVAVGLIGAALAGGAAVLGVGLLGGVAAMVTPGVTVGGGMAAGMGAMLSGGGALITGIVSAVAGVASFVSAGTLGATVGGIIGLARGAGKVGNENRAFDAKLQARGRSAASSQQQQMQAAMQQTYAMGVQDGQQAVVSQLQSAMHEQMLAQAAQEKAGGCKKCDSKIEALTQSRAAQAAAAGPSVA